MTVRLIVRSAGDDDGHGIGDSLAAMVGAPQTRLLVLRGNSASGKSTVAAALQRRLGRGVAWVEQDYLRRTVLREHDQPGLPNIGLIDTTIRFALDAGYHVIAEGIFFSHHYGAMLRDLTADHPGVTRHYYFDIPLAETQRRHLGKAFTVPAERLVDWYHERDLLGLDGEALITAEERLDEIVRRVEGELSFGDAPVRTRFGPSAHLA